MSVKIRLQRTGKRNAPFYRIVVMDESEKRNGHTTANLGTYDPKTDPPKIILDKKALDKWLSQGAKETDAVRKILS